ncbi:MAG: penicillin-binding protein 2 [bacterium]
MKRKSQKIQAEEIEYSEDSAESSFYRDSIIDEVPFDSPSEGAGFIKLPIGIKKLKRLFFLILIGLLIIFSRVFYLQIIKGDHYRGLAEGNRIKNKVIEAKRGIIYDQQMNQLVKNVPNFSIAVTLANLPKEEAKKEEIIDKAALILEKDPAELKQKINSIEKDLFYEPTIIEENVDQLKAIRFSIEEKKLTGFDLNTASVRDYLTTKSLAHALGYTGRINKEELKSHPDYEFNDYIGKTGLEFYYEKQLRGVPGLTQIEVDALGREKKVIAQQEPVAGNNLILSIDQKLQQKMEEVVTSHLKKINKRKAAVVILNPKTGEVLALASFPLFDNNEFAIGISPEKFKKISENPDLPLFNRPLMGSYPPGSAIKPIIASAALEEKNINENTTVLSTGGIRIGQWFFPDWKAGGHGYCNVKKALAESINTFFYAVGGGYQNIQGLGVDKINYYASLFGLNQTLGIDLPGEATGFLATAFWKEKTKGEKWYIGDTYHLAIGQGDISVTPLQVAIYTAVFANQGTLYQPYLVKNITDPNGEIIKKINPAIIRQNFISKENLRIVAEGMRQTITSGSARSLGSLKIKVAGKTGTAQWAENKLPQAWFTGFAPYENPEIVITVLVEEGGEGSSVSVPIAYDVLNWYFSQPDRGA